MIRLHFFYKYNEYGWPNIGHFLLKIHFSKYISNKNTAFSYKAVEKAFLKQIYC